MSLAHGISPGGSVVVGVSESTFGLEAFKWTESKGMVGLGEFPGGDFFSRADAASNNGTVIVGTSETASGQEAFIWTESRGMEG